MKKGLFVSFTIIFILLLSGCGQSNELKTLHCTLGVTVQEGTRIDTDYQVTYQKDNVTLIETVEKVVSNNDEYLELMKGMVESTYSPYKDVKYYDYDVKLDGDTLTSKTVINYEKIDTNSLIQINSAIGNILKDGKLKVDDIKEMYEKLGATCK